MGNDIAQRLVQERGGGWGRGKRREAGEEIPSCGVKEKESRG